MPAPDWLTARPIAHRGLHDEARGIIENTASAFEAAISHHYIIETDLQYSRDMVPVVFHDDTLERLMTEKGRLEAYTAAQLQDIPFRQTGDRIQTLPELLAQVNGRTPLLIEIKSNWRHPPDPASMTTILEGYKGPYAVMSFDPRIARRLRHLLPHVPRGMIASSFPADFWHFLTPGMRFKLRHLLYAPLVQPQFIAYSVNALPAAAPLLLKALGVKLLSWTIKTEEERRIARRYADNIIFEGLRP